MGITSPRRTHNGLPKSLRVPLPHQRLLEKSQWDWMDSNDMDRKFSLPNEDEGLCQRNSENRVDCGHCHGVPQGYGMTSRRRDINRIIDHISSPPQDTSVQVL